MSHGVCVVHLTEMELLHTLLAGHEMEAPDLISCVDQRVRAALEDGNWATHHRCELAKDVCHRKAVLAVGIKVRLHEYVDAYRAVVDVLTLERDGGTVESNLNTVTSLDEGCLSFLYLLKNCNTSQTQCDQM